MCVNGANSLRICSISLLPQSKISELKSRQKKGPGTASNFVFFKYLMLIFCWPTFVRSKWFKNVKPAFSLLSPPFSYRQFVKERRHEKYGHDRTRSILLILQQLLPTICMGNEKGRWKENFNFHIGLFRVKTSLAYHPHLCFGILKLLLLFLDFHFKYLFHLLLHLFQFQFSLLFLGFQLLEWTSTKWNTAKDKAR